MNEKNICYIDACKLSFEELITECKDARDKGWDKCFIFNREDKELKDEYLDNLRSLTRQVDIPIMVQGKVKRFEDVKKLLYTGASHCVIEYHTLEDKNVMTESLKRFQNKLIVEVNSLKSEIEETSLEETLSSETQKREITIENWIQENENKIKKWFSLGLCGILIREDNKDVQFIEEAIPKDILQEGTIFILKKETKKEKSEQYKLIELGKSTSLVSAIEFSQFKLNKDGLIPVVAQDYKTNEVLMVAYMNEESFLKTIESGRMTYYSRSRESLWTKGETSGHIQILMSLEIDCDKDTLLAKVKQTGAACHTGNKTCFYTNLVRQEYEITNPLTVLNQVMDVIKDRKANPKEGSYTNYLFDKGIDKILKKCGEEATEIIIAAKNPNHEELKYEISDFLYHMMVLMAECDLEWDDIVRELANR